MNVRYGDRRQVRPSHTSSRSVLKAFRNVVSDATATLVARVPVLEKPYIALGRRLQRLPVLHTVYRRSLQTLAGRLVRDRRQYRRLQVGLACFVFDVTDFTAGPLYFRNIPFEPLLSDWMVRNLRPGDVFVDVGSNRGFFTMLAADLVGPSGRVYAFEPNPSVFADLTEHVRRNSFEGRVRCFGNAVSDTDHGTMDLFVSQDEFNSGLSSVVPSGDLLRSGALDPAARVPVVTRSLDGWADEIGLSLPPAMVKIDVEGAESLVIAGMQRLLADRAPWAIAIETLPDGPVVATLRHRGYRVERLDRIDEKWNMLFLRPDGMS